MNENIENVLSKIVEEAITELVALDRAREQILKEQRALVRDCSVIIKKILRNEQYEYAEKLVELRQRIENCELIVKSVQQINYIGNYLQIMKQEYGEATLLHGLIKLKKLKSPEEIGLSKYNYLYALGDLIGELRRHTLNLLIKNEIEQALITTAYMEEIYDALFIIDFPNGLIPGLRKKIDVARNIFMKTQSEIIMAKANSQKI